MANRPWLRCYPFDLYEKFQRWCELEAWDEPLQCVLWVRRSKDEFSSGYAYSETGEIYMTAGMLAADGYAVLLHEMAHIAVEEQDAKSRKKYHGPAWRAAYLAAAEEVLGHKVHPKRMSEAGLRDAVLAGFCQAIIAQQRVR